jgi:hypothetical protein
MPPISVLGIFVAQQNYKSTHLQTGAKLGAVETNIGPSQAFLAIPGKGKIEEAMQKKKNSTQPEYLGVEQAAALTSMSVWFWRRKAYSGAVSSVKIGRRLLIPRAEIERMITENTRPRAAAAE